MRIPVTIALTALAACGNDRLPPKVQPIGDPDAAICDGPCMRARIVRCEAGGKAWRFKVSMSPMPPVTMYVSDAGLARIDIPGYSARGAGDERWRTCVERCPGTDLAKVCYPDRERYFLAPHVVEGPAVPGPSWQGHPSQVVRADGWSMTVVPTLRPVRDALIAVGILDEDSEVAAVDGLIVDNRNDGDDDGMTISELAEVPCDAFADPPGFRVFDSQANFARLDVVLPPLQRAEQEAMAARVTQPVPEENQIAAEILALRAKLRWGPQCSAFAEP